LRTLSTATVLAALRPAGALACGAALVLLAALAPTALAGQTGSAAAVSGTITATTGQPISGAVVTLTALGVGGIHEATTNSAGAYSFILVAPGSYEVRAEAFGFRPVVARTLVLTGGERGIVALALTPAPPPVMTVDTVALGGAVSSVWRGGAVRLGMREIADLPYRDEDLASIAALASSLDGSLGAQGLPGSMTQLVVDGVPVYRAQHPLARADPLSFGSLPRSALAGVTIHDNPSDMELGGSAGAYLAVTTRTGTSSGGLELEGAWSGDPLWSSSELDISTPSLTSFQGGGRTTIAVSPGVSQLVVSAEGVQRETPLGPRVSETLAGTLAGLDTDLVAELSAPSVERVERYSGLARFDMQRGVSSQFFLRADVGYTKRGFAGPGPIGLAREAALPEESVDYSAAAGLVQVSRPGLVFELRGGFSGSSRTFESAAADVPSATLVGTGSALGMVFGGPAESSRVDAVLLPTMRRDVGGGTLRLGVPVRAASHTTAGRSAREFFHTDGPALVAGQGLVHATTHPEASFSTKEISAFAQYDFEMGAGRSASLGARYDYEMIPGAEATLNTAWLQASGLRNDAYPSSFHQLGASASLTWDLFQDGSTTLSSVVSLHHGDVDPGVLAQLFTEDTGATATYFAGSGLDWPMSALPAGATASPTLTLFGPDTRAPRSARASAGRVRRLGGGWSLHLGGSYRRTDFHVRRRNLNLPSLPQATDAYGRDVYGTLQQDGSLVTATGSDARRFSGFNDVWALDPDGWSEQVAGTLGLQYASAASSLYASYTRSETTDNWLGGAQGLSDAALPPLLPASVGDWAEGTSDFDVPDRVAVAVTTSASVATLSAVYRFRSGLAFTPRYRAGVDANGDGSYRNDPAYVDAALVDPLLADWGCLSESVGGFAVRNSCRGPSVHSVDVRIRFRLGSVLGRDASLVLDGFDLIESNDGVIDDALLLVDPSATITGGTGTISVPVIANPGFGQVLYPTTPGRMLRIGLRIG
jgi:hypothetical protein